MIIVNFNFFLYRGYYFDTETGFYYLQSRYYDPSIMHCMTYIQIILQKGKAQNPLVQFCFNAFYIPIPAVFITMTNVANNTPETINWVSKYIGPITINLI